MKNSRKCVIPKVNLTRKERSASRLIHIETFKDEVCEVYDLMIGAGLDPIEAIRKTRSTLKAINYPNATYDVVMASLRASGRLRKNALDKESNEGNK
jgi:hypothetical protein